MALQFRCPGCGRGLSADSRSAGATLRCGGCGQLVEVPPAGERLLLKHHSSQTGSSLSGDTPLAGLKEPRLASASRGKPVGLRQLMRFPKVPLPDDRIDMTPMIDCVFLLLIFYVVTATFAYQKALEMPPAETDSAAPAKHLEEILESDEYIIIRVDKESVLWVNESEVRTRQDLLAKLRAALQKPQTEGTGRPSQLMVLADPEARHEAVVMALDAGNAVGMEQIRLATVAEEEF
ncbi:MAG: biopolymer transporter ExbD [Thermoguttaceae bacterium]|nr:biopolymer transporter ExbD [Thermoguttaceae bacterium]MDW8036731.1 biopolymer transporter ExbD [Thermoguttaceae bacterium]